MDIESKLHNQIYWFVYIILVWGNDLFNDVKIYHTFSSKSTENPPFCFFWDTRYLDGPAIPTPSQQKYANLQSTD